MEENRDTEMVYDLRMRYAEIVGDHLEDAARARKADNYPVYFKTLKEIWVVVQHKVKKAPSEWFNVITNKQDSGKSTDEYKYHVVRISLLANAYPNSWNGTHKNPNHCAEIENALHELESFLYTQIDHAKMFGTVYSQAGLS